MRPPRTVSLTRLLLAAAALLIVAVTLIACGAALVDDVLRRSP